MKIGIALAGVDEGMQVPVILRSWLAENGIWADVLAVSGDLLPGFFCSCAGEDFARSKRRMKKRRLLGRKASFSVMGRGIQSFYQAEVLPGYSFLFQDLKEGGAVALSNRISVNTDAFFCQGDPLSYEQMKGAMELFCRKRYFWFRSRMLGACHSQEALDCALNLMGAQRMLTFQVASGRQEAAFRRWDRKHMTVYLGYSSRRLWGEPVESQLRRQLADVRDACYDFLYF